MSNVEESHARLRQGAWCEDPAIASANDATCKFQPLSAGSGTYVYDEYSVTITSMPPGLTPEEFLLEFAKDPNGTVSHGLFNSINVFTKRTKTDPRIGDLYDIDIAGPDNGSIVLVALSPGFGVSTGDSWFDIQTVDCDKYGSHPENGAREFGFEYVSDGVKFYTRGVSRPGNAAIRLAGAAPQMMGWTSMMKGISNTIAKRGGMPKANSFVAKKFTKVL
jgi:hypothetical protein